MVATRRRTSSQSVMIKSSSTYCSGFITQPVRSPPRRDHDLEQKKQALRVLTRNIDTGTPEGRLFFHITAAFDEFQRELIVENTRAGLFRGSQKAGTQRRAAASFGQGQDSRRRGNAQGYRELSICRGCHRPPPDR
jgi:hypothetical protein